MEDLWIKEVEITNFQSHKHTKLNLVNGTNALVGSSNSGKTAVIRAIQWCLLNTPSGTGFIRVGEKEAAVTVTLSNGKTIERRRDKKMVNLYRLYENGEMIHEYTGFGNSVPPEIIEAHGIVPIAGDVYFQFAHQLEAPFMLSLKPKKRAEVLGNLEELARIDKALTDTNDDLRADSKQKKELEKQGKLLQLEFERMKMESERLSGKVDALKVLKEGIESKTSLRMYLEKQVIRLKEVNELVTSTQIEVEKAARIGAAYNPNTEERISWFQKLQSNINRLKDIKQEVQGIRFMKEDKLHQLETIKQAVEDKIGQFQVLDRSAKMLKSNQESFEKIEMHSEQVAQLDYSKTDIEVDKFKLLFQYLDRLRKIEESVNETDKLVLEASGHIEKALDDFVEALRDAEICPTCGQETHEVCTHNVELITN